MALKERTSEVLNLKLAEAQALLKGAKRGSRFYLSSIVHLPIEDKPGRVLESVASIKTTKAEALRFVETALSPILELRGARINIRVNHYEGDMGSFYHIG